MDLLSRWNSWRRARLRRHRAKVILDQLFSGPPEALAAGRLKPHHRHRIHLLEIDENSAREITRLLLGIIRHPKAHPLATRGEEVLEMLEYLPQEKVLRHVGGGNLSRR